jgi:hypothetical protein
VISVFTQKLCLGGPVTRQKIIPMSKYTEKSDKKQDAKDTKGMSPKQKAAFKKADEKHRKPKSQEDDAKMDKKIIKKLKKK